MIVIEFLINTILLIGMYTIVVALFHILEELLNSPSEYSPKE